MFEANNGSIEVATLEEALAKIKDLTASNEILKAEMGQHLDSAERANKERAIDFENAQRYLARVDEWQTKFADVREYIQASINRGEWEDELDEIFWHELADKLGLDLGLTEEIEVTFTVTYSGTVTVPKDTDLDELEIDLSSYPDVTLDGNHVGDVFQGEVEITRD